MEFADEWLELLTGENRARR